MDSDPLEDFSALAAFCRERCDEDEALARDHLCIHCRVHVEPLRNGFGITGYVHAGFQVGEPGDWKPGWQGRRCAGTVLGADHVQFPDRWLREVVAKRALLDAYEASVRRVGPGLSRDYLRLVAHQATAWNDHPDYLAEWAP